MKKRFSFLDPGDAELFDQPNRRLPRRVVESLKTPGDRAKKPEFPLSDVVRDQVAGLGRRVQLNWLESMCVAVSEGDGMSWSAEVVARLFEERFPNYHLIRVSSRLPASSLPAVTQLVPRRQFLKLVARRRLTSSFLGLAPWQRAALIAAILGAALVIRIVELAAKPYEHLAGHMQTLLASPAFLGLSSAAVVLAFVSERVLTHQLTRESADGIGKVREEIERRADSSAFGDLIEDLVAAMQQGPRPRGVVIDDFGGLDLTTRQAVLRYFAADKDLAPGANYWVLFEGEDGERFSPHTYHAREVSGFRQARLFRQLLLSPEERTQLAAAVDLPERADLSTVKAICSLRPEQLDFCHDFLLDYLASHPRREGHYSDVDLLFLLALAAEFGSRPYELKDLLGKLSGDTKGLRGRVLATFLPGTALGRDEFRTRLGGVQADLSRLLIADAAAGVTRYAVRPETKLTLEQHAAEFGLQPRGLGHLFWAILWFDKVQFMPVEAFWVRTIALHLRGADLSGLEPGELYASAEERIFLALLFTIDGALKTCVFEPIIDLLDRAVTLSSSTSLRRLRDQRRKMRRLCWQAYSVLADEAILAMLLRVDLPGERVERREPDERELRLQTLFVRSLVLPPPLRSHAEVSFLASLHDVDDLDPIRVYSGARSALLTLATLRAAGGEWLMPRWSQADCEGYLSQLLPRYTERLRAKKREERGPTDLIALSVGLDSLVTLLLRQAEVSPETLWLSLLAAVAEEASSAGGAEEPLDASVEEPSAAVEEDRSSSWEPLTGSAEDPAAAASEGPSVPAVSCFAILLDAAEDAVLLAGEHIAPAGLGAATDFVMTGLARELAVVAVSAVVSGLVVLRQFEPRAEAPAAWRRRAQEVVELARSVVEQLPTAATFDELTAATGPFIAVLDRALELSAFVWRRFELRSLAGLMQSRRLLFKRHSHGLRSHDAERFSPLLDALSDTLARDDFLGVYSHLIVSDLFADAAQLHAHYCLAAARTVLEGFYHQGLKRDFSFLAVAVAHHLDFDLAPFLTFLIQDEGGTPRLRSVLDQVEDSRFESVLMGLLNAAKKSDVGAAVRSVVRAAVEDPRRSPATVEIVAALLDLEALKERIGDGEIVDVDGIVEQWRPRCASWPYALMLTMLIGTDRVTDLIVDESLEVLERNSSPPSNSSYLFLASKLTNLLRSKHAELSAAKLPASYLKAAIGQWEKHLRADENLEIYRTLYQIDVRGRRLYEGKVYEWTEIQLQADEVARLAKLRNENQYFALFRYYFAFLRGWGLPIDSAPEVLAQRLRGSEEQRRELMEQWHQEGSRVPPPLIGSQKAMISANFLVLGEYLFGQTGGQDGAAQDDRQRFNDAAAGAIQRMLQLSASLDLPRSISELLRLHSQRFLSYSSLDDDS